jgi:hypothetical protein
MNNHKITRIFTERFCKEIGTLIADFNLQATDIRIVGNKPDWNIWKIVGKLPLCDVNLSIDGEGRLFYANRFDWNRIIDNTSELHYGLVLFAHNLYLVRQWEKIRYADSDDTAHSDTPTGPAQRPFLHAVDTVQRLFNLLPEDEVAMFKHDITIDKDYRKYMQQTLHGKKGREYIVYSPGQTKILKIQ